MESTLIVIAIIAFMVSGMPRVRSGRPQERKRGQPSLTGEARRQKNRAIDALRRAAKSPEVSLEKREKGAARHSERRTQESSQDQQQRPSNMRTHNAARRASLPKALEVDYREHLEKTFEDYMSSFLWSTCKNCHESILSRNVTPRRVPATSAEKIRSALLQPITWIHQMFLTNYLACPRQKFRVHPVISVYTVRGQQFSYNGQVITFPQDVNELAAKLPHISQDLTSILVVRRSICERYSDFNVNRMKVYNALRWLCEIYLFYKEVIIDRGNLDLLPENKNISHMLQSVPVMNTEDTEVEAADELLNCDVHHSGVPSSGCTATG